MIYLLWGILNVGLFAYFILICLKATRLVRERVGMFAALIMVFGLLSFMGNTYKEVRILKSGETERWTFVPEEKMRTMSTSLTDHVLEKTPTFKTGFLLKTGMDPDTKEIAPVSANSWTSGLSIGTRWKPSIIVVSKTNIRDLFQYHVSGTMTWSLLGLVTYSRSQTYRGTVQVK